DFGVHLVGGDLQQRLVNFYGVADLLEPASDGAFGDALAEGGKYHRRAVTGGTLRWLLGRLRLFGWLPFGGLLFRGLLLGGRLFRGLRLGRLWRFGGFPFGGLLLGCLWLLGGLLLGGLLLRLAEQWLVAVGRTATGLRRVTDDGEFGADLDGFVLGDLDLE